MINCNFKFTIPLYKYPIHLVLCLYKAPNQISHLYKEHVNLYTYQNFTLTVISYSLPNDKKILNDMVLITMLVGHFLIILESNNPWLMSSLCPL